MMVARRTESVFNGFRVSVWEVEKVTDIDDGDGSTSMRMYLMPQNCTLQSGLNGKF